MSRITTTPMQLARLVGDVAIGDERRAGQLAQRLGRLGDGRLGRNTASAGDIRSPTVLAAALRAAVGGGRLGLVGHGAETDASRRAWARPRLGGLLVGGADAFEQRVLAMLLLDRFLAAAGLVEQVERGELVMAQRAGGEIDIVLAGGIVQRSASAAPSPCGSRASSSRPCARDSQANFG